MDGCRDAHAIRRHRCRFSYFFFFVKIGEVLFRQRFDLDFSKGRKMSLG
jgi:hypothetical protein